MQLKPVEYISHPGRINNLNNEVTVLFEENKRRAYRIIEDAQEAVG